MGFVIQDLSCETVPYSKILLGGLFFTVMGALNCLHAIQAALAELLSCKLMSAPAASTNLANVGNSCS
jgi:hypothetical protein